MKLLVKNIRCLAGVEYSPKPRLQGKEMAEVGTIDNAWLIVEDGRFAGFGSEADGMPQSDGIDDIIDAEGGMVLKQHWVEGKHYWESALRILDKMMPDLLDAKLQTWLDEYFE